MSHHEEQMDNYQMEASRWSAGRNVLAFVALVAIVACAAGYLQDPSRFFRSYMVAFAFAAATGLGAFFFVAVQFLSGAVTWPFSIM